MFTYTYALTIETRRYTCCVAVKYNVNYYDAYIIPVQYLVRDTVFRHIIVMCNNIVHVANEMADKEAAESVHPNQNVLNASFAQIQKTISKNSSEPKQNTELRRIVKTPTFNRPNSIGNRRKIINCRLRIGRNTRIYPRCSLNL